MLSREASPRKSAVLIARYHSALILAGILPLDLRIQKAAALYEARRGSFGLVLGDREVERLAQSAEVPHPSEQIPFHFIYLIKQYQLTVHASRRLHVMSK